MPTIHLLIKGNVQGVFYRANAKKTADKLTVTGWVQNNRDGHVEAVATGERDKLEKFIKWCRQGPPAANVTDVYIEEYVPADFETFEIKRHK